MLLPGVGKCPVEGILNITVNYLFEIISIVGCEKLGHLPNLPTPVY